MIEAANHSCIQLFSIKQLKEHGDLFSGTAIGGEVYRPKSTFPDRFV